MSSRRAERRRACERKAQYVTSLEASIRARALRRQRIGVFPYKCPFCPHWHVGHLPKRKRQARSAAILARRAAS
jgi:hypothetical protein